MSNVKDTCGCLETYPQLVLGKVSHGPGCRRSMMMRLTPRTSQEHEVAMHEVVGDDYSGAYKMMLEYACMLERELNAALDINDVNADVAYKLQIQLVRQAIFHVLDEGNPRMRVSSGYARSGLEWDFDNDEERVDFADQVVAWFVRSS